jgi:hypothetical protein
VKYGDFSSLVQLGVGLHLGTALIQLYGEIGFQPLIRTIARTRNLFLAESPEERPKPEIKAELEDIESRLEILKIQIFNEYKKYIIINSCIAAVLVIKLVFITITFNRDITSENYWVAIILVVFSILPAPITLLSLWIDASRQVKPLKKRADDLEKRAQQSSSGNRS